MGIDQCEVDDGHGLGGYKLRSTDGYESVAALMDSNASGSKMSLVMDTKMSQFLPT